MGAAFMARHRHAESGLWHWTAPRDPRAGVCTRHAQAKSGLVGGVLNQAFLDNAEEGRGEWGEDAPELTLVGWIAPLTQGQVYAKGWRGSRSWWEGRGVRLCAHALTGARAQGSPHVREAWPPLAQLRPLPCPPCVPAACVTRTRQCSVPP